MQISNTLNKLVESIILKHQGLEADIKTDKEAATTLNSFFSTNHFDRIAFLKENVEGCIQERLKVCSNHRANEIVLSIFCVAGFNLEEERLTKFTTIKDLLSFYGYYLSGLFNNRVSEAKLFYSNDLFIHSSV